MRVGNPIFLDSRLRGSDGKTELVDGLSPPRTRFYPVSVRLSSIFQHKSAESRKFGISGSKNSAPKDIWVVWANLYRSDGQIGICNRRVTNPMPQTQKTVRNYGVFCLVQRQIRFFG
jgi:hypothetical protein